MANQKMICYIAIWIAISPSLSINAILTEDQKTSSVLTLPDITLEEEQELSHCPISTNGNLTTSAYGTDTTPEWESYTFLQLHEHFNCSEYVYNSNKPLYTVDMWKKLRDLFTKQSEIDLSSFRPDETHISNYYSDYAEEKGRGTFASRNFSKGELVHDGSISTVFWNDGISWKEYVMALPPPMACDVLEWTWIQEVQDYDWLLCLNLNDAAFMNHDDNFNIAPKSSTSLEFYAVRGKKL